MVSVQAILGHKWIDMTLGYARLYDGTLAVDYYQAMNEVERQLELVERPRQDAPSLGGAGSPGRFTAFRHPK